FEYTTHRPTEKLFVVDFSGMASDSAGGARVLDSDVVSSYRVLQYRGGEKAIVRLEVLLRVPVVPKVERTGSDGLTLTFALSAAARAPESARARPAPSIVRARVATRIQSVEVTAEAGQAKVAIHGNGQLRYETQRLASPDRLVLDFADTRLVGRAREVKSAIEPVRGVRLGQFKPDVSRVVIDLTGVAAFAINPGTDSIEVVFASSLARSIPQPLKAVPKPAVAPLRLNQPRALRRVAYSPQANVPAPEVPYVTNAAMVLPANLTEPAAALARPAAPKSDPAPRATTSTPRATSAKPQAPYGGEPISVNFKDIDLKDFFRLIHEISGLNVVVDPTVSGKVTIVLDEVPWDQALDIVLRNNSLDKQLEGNVLRIATKATLKREAEERRDLAKAEAEAVPKETITRTLSYAKASAVRDTLRRFLSPRGEILADERSNTLVINDIPSVFPAINTLLDQLDRKAQQVEIEARVVSATRTFARELGTQFGFATTGLGGRNVFGGLVGRGDFVSPIERGPGLPPPPLVASGTNQIPLNTNLGVGAPTSGVSFAHSSPNFALDFIISAAESKGVGKLLSRPKVITQNNEPAVVKQGTKIPIQTVINNTITVQFIDAVLKLEVTPQITAEGTIFMEILVENTAIDEGIPRIQNIPALTTQSAETKVLIGDGGTVVVGGIIISSQRTDISQVPLLGSIPIIGHLFKRTSVSSNSQELLFFVTPRIVAN
ncbi:MAG: type IV pilus secretin PilQ, partial [Candidatus Acidiferrales bacterium]